MRVLGLAVSVVAVLLIGCSKPATYQNFADEKTSAELIKPPPRGKDGSAADANAPAPVPASPSAPMLAYAYDYGLELPSRRLPGVVADHQAACASAGPAVCQVTASTLERSAGDQVHATLTLRATPAWLATFRKGLSQDAATVGGRVTRANVTSEDLSRQVTDTQAAIRAKTSLRDRLQAILNSRPAKTADLVETETALANVQGELDASQSEMAMMRQRLDSSVITIDYQSAGVPARPAWTPVSSAIDNFAMTLATGLGFLITCIAALLPWALVIGATVWAFRGPLARLRARSRRKPAPPAPPAS